MITINGNHDYKGHVNIQSIISICKKIFYNKSGKKVIY